MDYGMPTLIEHNNLLQSMELCAKLGLQFVELNMNLPMYQVDRLKDSKYFMELANRYQVYYTIHLDETLDICNYNSKVAKAWMGTVIDTIDIAKKLHVPVLNLHMNYGVYFTLPGQRIYLYDQYREDYLSNLRHFRELCEREIGSELILISIENTEGYTDFQKQAINMLLESKIFSLTWDIGHSFLAKDSDVPFIFSQKEKLRHMHIHDGKEGKNHLALGKGEIELNKYLTIAKDSDCRCVVETKTIKALEASVEWLRCHNYLA